MKKLLTIIFSLLITLTLIPVSIVSNEVEAEEPSQEEEYDDDGYLCFTANTDGSTIMFWQSGSAGVIKWSGSYSTDGSNWKQYDLDTIITLENAGDKVYFKGTYEPKESYNLMCKMTGSIAASGNIMSLCCGDNYQNVTEIPYDNEFYGLFYGCISLTRAPSLPATTLKDSCYAAMFAKTSLTSAPELPATTLGRHSYYSMFAECPYLILPPELPATELPYGCYSWMFSKCTSLIAPADMSHVNEFGEYSVNGMYHDCSSLKLYNNYRDYFGYRTRWKTKEDAIDIGNGFSSIFDGVIDQDHGIISAEIGHVYFIINDIYYDGNGAEGDAPCDIKDYVVGDTVKVLDNDTLSKDYYVFSGWNTKADGSGITYKPGDTFEFKEKTVLYAVWKKASQTITLDKNGGTGGKDKVFGQDGELLPALTNDGDLPTKVGYHFVGYYDEDNNKYYDESGIPVLVFDKKIDTTLYAHWEVNKYTVSFDANKPANASGEVSGTMADESFTYGETKALTKNGYSLTGWTFKGWALTNDGEVKYADEASVKNLTSTNNDKITLYAVWEANTYTVTLNSDGGTGGKSSITVTYDSLLPALTGEDDLPTKEGWAFKGYYYHDEHSQDVPYYDNNGYPLVNYKLDKNVTLIARYAQAADFYWGIDTNNVLHLSTTATTIATTKTDGVYTKESDVPWNSSKGSITKVVIDDDIVVTKMAYWFAGLTNLTSIEGLDKLDISGVAQGQNLDMSHMFDGCSSIKEIDLSGIVVTNANVVDTSYMFNGCSSLETILVSRTFRVGKASTTSTDMFKDCTKLVGGSATTYDLSHVDASYAKIDKYENNEPGYFTLLSKITLDSVDGTPGTTKAVEVPYVVNAKGEATESMPELTGTGELPSKTGYAFEGYYDALEGGNQYYKSDGTSAKNWDKKVTSATLYAHYENNVYQVKLVTNGGTASKTTVNATYDKDMPVLTASELPTKTGYTFLGYFDNETAGTKYYNADGSSAKPYDVAGVTTLYAHWQLNNYTVYFDANKPDKATNNVTGETKAQTFTYNETKALTANGYALTNWTFKGWAETKDGEVKYNDKAEVTNISTEGVKTLYAVWEANTYTITYNANKPSTASSEVEGKMANQTLTYDNSQNLSINLYTLTGWNFKGWSDTKDGEVKYLNGQAVSNLTVTTLYAVWEANTYTIIYDGNGGEGKMEASTFTYDTAKNLTKNTYTRTGFNFGGWSKTSAGSKEYDDGASIKNLTSADKETITLYAVWLSDNSHKITVNNPEIGGTLFASAGVAKEGNKITLRSTLDDGYELTSVIVKKGEETIEVKDNTFVMPNGDVTVTPTFTKVKATSISASRTNIVMEVGNTTEVKINYLPSNAYKELKFTYSDGDVVEAHDAGGVYMAIEAKQIGTTIITVTVNDGSSNPASVKIAVNVLSSENNPVIYEKQNYTKGSKVDLNFKSNDEILHFIDSYGNKWPECDVLVDGKVLTYLSDYKASEGSIKITLYNSFVEKLSSGTHTITIKSQNGIATDTFTIYNEPYVPVDTASK